MARLLALLQDKGWLIRSESTEDRRVRQLHLSMQGHASVSAARRPARRAGRRTAEGLSGARSGTTAGIADPGARQRAADLVYRFAKLILGDCYSRRDASPIVTGRLARPRCNVTRPARYQSPMVSRLRERQSSTAVRMDILWARAGNSARITSEAKEDRKRLLSSARARSTPISS
jgi:hypothetical protein